MVQKSKKLSISKILAIIGDTNITVPMKLISKEHEKQTLLISFLTRPIFIIAREIGSHNSSQVHCTYNLYVTAYSLLSSYYIYQQEVKCGTWYLVLCDELLYCTYGTPSATLLQFCTLQRHFSVLQWCTPLNYITRTWHTAALAAMACCRP